MRIFLLFCAVFSLVSACQWLDDIKEKSIKFELSGAGLHHKLEGHTKIMSTRRFRECRILYIFKLPAGAYVDSDSVNASLTDHSFHSTHRFDVEAPAHKSREQTVYLLKHASIRTSFILEDHFLLPVHLRYHMPSESAKTVTVEFKSPLVFLDCPADYKPEKLDECDGKISFFKQGVPSQSPHWVSLEPMVRKTVDAKLPVGSSSLTFYVEAGTIVTVIVALLLITAGNQRKEKSE